MNILCIWRGIAYALDINIAICLSLLISTVVDTHQTPETFQKVETEREPLVKHLHIPTLQWRAIVTLRTALRFQETHAAQSAASVRQEHHSTT